MLLLLLLRWNRVLGDDGAGATGAARPAAAAGGGHGVVLLRRMGEKMLFEMRLLGERLGAHLALMRLFSRVNLLVALQIGLTAETFVALGTNVGGAVGEQMLLEMTALREGFHADGAFVGPLTGVDFFVTLKIRLIAEAFVARGACERRIGGALSLRPAFSTFARGFRAAAGAAVRAARRRRRRGRGSRLGFRLLVSFVVDGGGGGRRFRRGIGGEIVVVLPCREDHRGGIE